MLGSNGLVARFKVLQQAEAAMVDDEVGLIRDGIEVPVWVTRD